MAISLRERIFAQSPKRFVRLGLTFPDDCRIKDWHYVYDRHERHGIVVRPRHYVLETWWEAYYRLDAGYLVLTGLALGCPMDRPPQRIQVRDYWEAGSMGLGHDMEWQIENLLLCDLPADLMPPIAIH